MRRTLTDIRVATGGEQEQVDEHADFATDYLNQYPFMAPPI